MSERHVTAAQMEERKRVMALRPKEEDFKGRKGYERYHHVEVGGERIKVKGERPDGSYEWAYHFPVHGTDESKAGREYSEVGEMFKPFQRADVERVANSPALTAQSASRSGGIHTRWARGGRVERGTDGELYHCGVPTGRWCLGTPWPWQKPPEGGLPDGSMKGV